MSNKEKKTKVCHLSSVHYALDTRIFYKFCKSLSQSGYEVSLIAFHPKDEIIENIHIIPFKRYHNRRFRMLFAWLHMYFKALRVNAPVYHFHDPELIPCGILLRLSGKKVIYDIHENIADDIFDKPWIKNKKVTYALFNLIERFSLRFFKVILAETSYLKRYEKLTSATVIQNFCDLEFFQPFRKQEPGNPFKLFYIGIVLENRGFLEICEAVYLLHKKGMMVEFHCVGELYTDLRNKIEKLPFYEEIKSSIIFYGRKTLDMGYDLQLSNQFGIGLCIIHPMKNSRESYPTKLFEYMAVGLPVVTSDFTLYKQVVEANKTGICVNPLDAKDISEGIAKLITDKSFYDSCLKNGYITVKEKYNWDGERKKLLEVYREI